MKRILGSAVFKVAISLSLIIVLLYIMKGNYAAIAKALKNTDIRIFAMGFAIFLAALGMTSYRLFLIIRAQGGPGVNYKEAFSLSLIGLFFNNFLPTSMG
ncbi:MAG: lysylphosphatidylglycerol synthase domain-containing protein, partial [Candidatus Omnitrophota bacterium]